MWAGTSRTRTELLWDVSEFSNSGRQTTVKARFFAGGVECQTYPQCCGGFEFCWALISTAPESSQPAAHRSERPAHSSLLSLFLLLLTLCQPDHSTLPTASSALTEQTDAAAAETGASPLQESLQLNYNRDLMEEKIYEILKVSSSLDQFVLLKSRRFIVRLE
ncbi:hypothetical protein JZ751_024432, partial [Albula glossodonta]